MSMTNNPPLSEGPYFRGNSQESKLGVILLAMARGYKFGTSDKALELGGAFPVLTACLRDLSTYDLEAECNCAAGILTSDWCGPDHIFGYMSDWDSWGVWPI